MNKQLERALQILHGEYQFDLAVPEHHKNWWFQTSLRYLQGYCRFFREAETCQELFWEDWWSHKVYRDEDDKKGSELNTYSFGVIELNQFDFMTAKRNVGGTLYWVEWLGFKTQFNIWEVADKIKWLDLVKRGVPFDLIKYCYSQLIQRPR